MKKIGLILSFICSALFVTAQVSKITILETIDRDNSIPYAHKLMLRANLSEAITNTPGFESYDRSDISAVISEQELQKTGAVSDEQIRQLGELTGANYILLTEAVKADENNMFVIAKILNVENAKTERTSNLLMAMTSAEIQKGCKELAANLLVDKEKEHIDKQIQERKVQSQRPSQLSHYTPENDYHVFISRIDRTNTETKVKFSLVSSENAQICILPSTYLIDRTTGERYKLKDAANIPISEYSRKEIPAGFYQFTLVFPPIPESTVSIDIIEDHYEGWKFKYIELYPYEDNPNLHVFTDFSIPLYNKICKYYLIVTNNHSSGRYVYVGGEYIGTVGGNSWKKFTLPITRQGEIKTVQTEYMFSPNTEYGRVSNARPNDTVRFSN